MNEWSTDTSKIPDTFKSGSGSVFPCSWQLFPFAEQSHGTQTIVEPTHNTKISHIEENALISSRQLNKPVESFAHAVVPTLHTIIAKYRRANGGENIVYVWNAENIAVISPVTRVCLISSDATNKQHTTAPTTPTVSTKTTKAHSTDDKNYRKYRV